VREAAAISSLGVVVALVLSRPTIRRFRVGPATAAALGVLLMLLAGLVRPDDIREAATVLWRPLLTVTAIMVMAATARRLGVLSRLAAGVVPLARGSTTRLFGFVFALSALTAAVLNNDAAVLVLTPLVVLLVRERYPDQPKLLVPFAFAVFMAAGVAPFVVSNPMNMILAEVVGIGFNSYAARMIPISVAGWIVTYLVLHLIFRGRLSTADPSGVVAERPHLTRLQRQLLVVLLLVLGSYPLVAYIGGPIWAVAVSGALVALWLCVRGAGGTPGEIMLKEVSWETLGFLVGALVLAFGLRNAGVVDWLTDAYRGGHHAVIGIVSALGSALINNHPMALINLLALGDVGGVDHDAYLAALIGGDLGPRLLPNGSLAGLLWLASLRSMGVDVSVGRFALVGAAVTVPSIGVSLGLLELLR
jgi:arsenical pump membrane protein